MCFVGFSFSFLEFFVHISLFFSSLITRRVSVLYILYTCVCVCVIRLYKIVAVLLLLIIKMTHTVEIHLYLL